MNKLKQVVADKCNELNITHQSLSKALGHSEVYLYDVMRKGVTTAKQDQLITRIGDIKEYKSDAEIIAELKGRLEIVDDFCLNQADIIENLRNDINGLVTTYNEEISKRNAIIESKDSIIDDQAGEIKYLKEANSSSRKMFDSASNQIHHLESTMKTTKREYLVWLSIMGAAFISVLVWWLLK